MRSAEAWPALPLAGWLDTYDTLHRWTQIVGKTRMRFAPAQNHWWHTTLYLTARGLDTSPIPAGGRTFSLEFDFIDHALVARSSDGGVSSITLTAMAVAEFYRNFLVMMQDIGVPTRIWPVPMEMADQLRFDDDRLHRSYDPGAAHACWRILASADEVLKQFRGRFLGKSSPSHFWWGGFDLSCTRFSGRPAPPHPGGIPNCPDFVTREAYSQECISVGWWPGNVGGLEEPAFYAYVYPEPPGCVSARVGPAGAAYDGAMREWILPYETVRRAPDPGAAVLEFCETTYAAAANLSGWDRGALERP